MKIGLIIQREYLTRVRKKSFWVLTLLVPVLLVAAGIGAGYLIKNSSSKKLVLVSDKSGLFKNQLKNTADITFIVSKDNVDSLRKHIDSIDYDAVLDIPAVNFEHPGSYPIYSKEQLGAGPLSAISNQLNAVVKNQRLRQEGISQAQLDKLDENVINLQPKVGKNEESKNSDAASALGYICGLLLYFMLLMYGTNIMRSVMEEKTNRIAEIMVSSVRPIELMFGKIIGVGLVGLTQILLWLVLIVVAGTVGVGVLASHSGNLGAAAMAPSGAGNMTKMDDNMIQQALMTINWLRIGFWFLFYFVSGYFLYASLYAAVGTLVNDDQQDGQQFTMIVTIPVIFAFVMLNAAIQDPNSKLAVAGSLIPFTSPIVMLARLPYDVPLWQLLTSAGLMLLTFLGVAWVSAKIYRTAILMYGKKFTLPEVGKWLFKKD